MKNILYISIISILVSCSSNTETETKKEDSSTVKTNGNLVELTDAQLQNAGIQLGKAEQKNISSLIKVNGSIDVPPQNIVSVSVPLGGYLKTTKLLPGMHVAKGEVIGVVEDPQYIQMQQDYLTAKAQLIYAEGEYNRQKTLNQTKATSDKNFQQTQANYNTQQILVNALSQKLKLIGINPDRINATNISRSINIYSPINGFVTKVNVNIGKYVTPSDVLFEIVNPSDIHLALDIFEKDINSLHIGQQLTAYTNNDTSKKYECTIVLIGKELSVERKIEVHCHFQQYDDKLIPGMFMTADIHVADNNGYTLPSDAIVNFENKSYVFVSKDKNHFELTVVKTGAPDNSNTQINLNDSGLYQNAQFVTAGAYSLLMKMKNTSEEE